LNYHWKSAKYFLEVELKCLDAWLLIREKDVAVSNRAAGIDSVDLPDAKNFMVA